MEYGRLAIVLLLIVVAILSVGFAEKRALLPGGVGFEAGDHVVRDRLAMIVYTRGEVGEGSLVVVCTGSQCFLGNVTGVGRNVVQVSGDPASLPAPVNPRSRGLYVVRAVVPAPGWAPLLALLAGLAFLYAYRRGGGGLALLYAWALLTVPLYSLMIPEVYTGVPRPPRAEVVRVEPLDSYQGLVLEADLGGHNFTQPTGCRVTAGNETFPAAAYAEGNRIYVAVPSRAWLVAAEYYRARTVFLTIQCRAGIEGLEPGRLMVSVTARVELEEPRLKVEDDVVVVVNPSPVPVRLEGTVYYTGPTERFTVNETILPGGELRIHLDGHRRMVFEGRIIAPWGVKPVGAVLP